jgi:AraC-like DNA-binding protein
MFRKIDESLVAEARHLGGQGLTSYAIAGRLGVDPTTVQRWLGGNRRRGPQGRTDVRDALILELHDRESLSFAEIARRVHMSPTGVRMRYYSLTGRERPDRAR